jgi:hypothetical protein
LLAEVYRNAGRPADAAAATRERRSLWDGNPDELFRVACDFAQVADAVGRGRTELSDPEKAEKSGYVEEALATLRQAVAAGFRDKQRLQTESRLTALRQLDDFSSLLKNIP